MAYVGLNPIRAAVAKTPEQSDYTSIQERIERPENSCLRPFEDKEEIGIPFNLKEYLELVDWGGREVKHNKRGYIPANTPPILTRLRMDAVPVLDYLARAFAKSIGRKFIKGHVLGDRLCPEKA